MLILVSLGLLLLNPKRTIPMPADIPPMLAALKPDGVEVRLQRLPKSQFGSPVAGSVIINGIPTTSATTVASWKSGKMPITNFQPLATTGPSKVVSYAFTISADPDKILDQLRREFDKAARSQSSSSSYSVGGEVATVFTQASRTSLKGLNSAIYLNGSIAKGDTKGLITIIYTEEVPCSAFEKAEIWLNQMISKD